VFHVHAASCGGYQHGVRTGPVSCPRPVVAGLVFNQYERRPSVWWAFTCAGHVGHLIAARPLLERDRAELARRRYYYDRRELDPDQRPLAVGMAARELVERARRWACCAPGAHLPSSRRRCMASGAGPDPASLGERATPLWVARVP